MSKSVEEQRAFAAKFGDEVKETKASSATTPAVDPGLDGKALRARAARMNEFALEFSAVRDEAIRLTLCGYDVVFTKADTKEESSGIAQANVKGLHALAVSQVPRAGSLTAAVSGIVMEYFWTKLTRFEVSPGGYVLSMERDLAHALFSELNNWITPGPTPAHPETATLSASPAALRKAIDYAVYHLDNPAKEIEKPLKSANLFEFCCQWDAEFCEIEQDLLFEIILLANYLQFQPLVDLACAKVASMVKGKTPEQMRKTFNIVSDFTAEEEEAVRAESQWVEEE